MATFDNKMMNYVLGNPLRIKRQPISRSQKNEVLSRQKYRCVRCKKQLDLKSTHFDHIKEVYKGGKSTISNLQALCVVCHSNKTHVERLKRVEKRRKLNTFSYWINPLTGKKEKIVPLKSPTYKLKL